MAYNSNPPQAKYIATAGQTTFPFIFKIFADPNLVVYQVADGADPETVTALDLNIDYTVTIDGDNGGVATLTVPAALNCLLYTSPSPRDS